MLAPEFETTVPIINPPPAGARGEYRVAQTPTGPRTYFVFKSSREVVAEALAALNQPGRG